MSQCQDYVDGECMAEPTHHVLVTSKLSGLTSTDLHTCQAHADMWVTAMADDDGYTLSVTPLDGAS